MRTLESYKNANEETRKILIQNNLSINYSLYCSLLNFDCEILSVVVESNNRSNDIYCCAIKTFFGSILDGENVYRNLREYKKYLKSKIGKDFQVKKGYKDELKLVGRDLGMDKFNMEYNVPSEFKEDYHKYLTSLFDEYLHYSFYAMSLDIIEFEVLTSIRKKDANIYLVANYDSQEYVYLSEKQIDFLKKTKSIILLVATKEELSKIDFKSNLDAYKKADKIIKKRVFEHNKKYLNTPFKLKN